MRRYFTSPWWAVFFIFFFPLIVTHGYVEFVRSSELNSRLGWFLMIGGLAYLMRKTWLQKLLLGVLVLMAFSGAFDILYASTFGGVFTSASFEAIALSDQSEATEFVFAYSSLQNVLLVSFYLAVVYWSVRNIDFKAIENRRQKVLAGLGVLMALVAVQQVVDRGRYFDVFPGFIGVGIDYARNQEGMDAIIEQRKQLYQSAVYQAKSHDSAQTYVIVIGESLNRNHLQFYGYQRDTTPSLAQYKDEIIRFDNVVSAFAQTAPSLSYALTQANVENKMPYQNAASLIGVAKKAGFKTFWLSNQQPLRTPTTPLAAISDKAHFISHDFKGVENHRYDGYLLPTIDEALADPAQKKVIFVHLMGSHLQYRNRYPAEFDYFKGQEGVRAYTDKPTDTELQFINEYDNSVRYTDYVLGEVLARMKITNAVAAMSFWADHGEEVFASKDFKGHGPDGVTKNMVEIPFVLWRNQAYRNQFAAQDDVLNSSQNKAFMLDDYFYFGLCMMAIESELNDSSRSLCHQDYQQRPRIIYGKNYDEAWQ